MFLKRTEGRDLILEKLAGNALLKRARRNFIIIFIVLMVIAALRSDLSIAPLKAHNEMYGNILLGLSFILQLMLSITAYRFNRAMEGKRWMGLVAGLLCLLGNFFAAVGFVYLYLTERRIAGLRRSC